MSRLMPKSRRKSSQIHPTKKHGKLPMAGASRIHLLPQVLKLVQKNKTTLIFTNTRAQCEIWFHRLLESDPNLAGNIAMHHGSIDKKIRLWVEDALREEQLKVVVCTSSLDLGVDFSPVKTACKLEVLNALGSLTNVLAVADIDPKLAVPFTFFPHMPWSSSNRWHYNAGSNNNKSKTVSPFLILMTFYYNF